MRERDETERNGKNNLLTQNEKKILAVMICCVNVDDTEQMTNRILCMLKHEQATVLLKSSCKGCQTAIGFSTVMYFQQKQEATEGLVAVANRNVVLT